MKFVYTPFSRLPSRVKTGKPSTILCFPLIRNAGYTNKLFLIRGRESEKCKQVLFLFHIDRKPGRLFYGKQYDKHMKEASGMAKVDSSHFLETEFHQVA
jgi:hypothetical protein